MNNTTQSAEQNEPEVVKCDGPKLTPNERFMLIVLYDLEDFLYNRSDVIDSDCGEPEPNRAMVLLGEVRLAIRIAEKGK